MVDAAALAIEEPTPFVEITYHIGDMNPQHAAAFSRSCRMFVYYADSGPIHSFPFAVDTSGDVDVFGIHEETLVE